MELTCWTIRCSRRRILPSTARRTLSMIAGTSCRLLADRYELAQPHPVPAVGTCAVSTCTRLASDGAGQYNSSSAIVGEIAANAEPTDYVGQRAPGSPSRIA